MLGIIFDREALFSSPEWLATESVTEKVPRGDAVRLLDHSHPSLRVATKKEEEKMCRRLLNLLGTQHRSVPIASRLVVQQALQPVLQLEYAWVLLSEARAMQRTKSGISKICEEWIRTPVPGGKVEN